MKNNLAQKTVLYTILLLISFSCKEEVVIDLESGDRMIGIYGSITTEKKKHAVTISRSMDFYLSGEPEMVSNAVVSLFDGTNTIEFAENPQQRGVYETIEEFAGEVGVTYKLSVDITEKNGSKKHFSAENTIRPIPEQIDSAKILPVYTFTGKERENRLKICPYFQSIADRDMNYLIKIAINDALIADTITRYPIMRMAELSGLYFNGPEMKLIFNDLNFPIGVYNLNTEKPDENIQTSDKVTIFMYSIDNEYRRFIQDIRNSSGSNPMWGTPTNVRSNIEPAGKALGFFYTASVIEYSFVYDGESEP